MMLASDSLLVVLCSVFSGWGLDSTHVGAHLLIRRLVSAEEIMTYLGMVRITMNKADHSGNWKDEKLPAPYFLCVIYRDYFTFFNLIV
jgi:hypothetical protein